MSYVMVPVPEEYVMEVLQYMMRLVFRASVVEWDDEAVEDYFGRADELSRATLSLVARAALAGKTLTQQQAADFLQLNVRETTAIVREINEAVAQEKRSPLLALTASSEVLPNGRTRDVVALTMLLPHARMVRAAEAAVDAREPHPLEGQS
jgi:hypothetical protein